MVNFQNKKIFYTLKEYQKNYSILLNNYLQQHEDFDELMFLENELQFYNLCYDNSNVITGDFGDGQHYCINGGHCEVLIKEINDAISLGDEYNIELYTKYKTSFHKILQFLINRKDEVSIAVKHNYNPILNSSSSPEIKQLLINILHNKLSLFNAINQINNITTSDTYDLFLNEFNMVYHRIICDFMFTFDEDTILEAIEINEYDLPYVYYNEEEIVKAKHFLRDIGKYKTVFNVFGFGSVEKNISTKYIHLNNLMIDYCDGFCHQPIEGFENLISLKNVYEHINKLSPVANIKNSAVNNHEDIQLPKEKKPSEKWYALLYLLELKASNSKPPTNYEGDFIRKEIEEIGKKRTGTTGQSFYRECLKINEIINNKSLLEKSFDKDWKQKVINISNNNELIISYLKTNY